MKDNLIKILCITGTRADYGIYKPLLYELLQDPLFNLQLVVTGMHVLQQYGNTIQEIRQDGFTIVASPSILFKGDSTYAMSQSLGMALLYFSDIYHHHPPDFVLLLGDRGEMLAAAIAAHYQNIIIIHLHGGEISGSADDSIRHTISKLANLHFVATSQSKQNLLKLGEEEWRITPIGSLRKTDILNAINLPSPDKQDLIAKYNMNTDKKKILLVMHPDSKEFISFKNQIGVVLDAFKEIRDIHLSVIGPNSDAGGDVFRAAILSFLQMNSNTTSSYYPSIPSDEFLFLLSQIDLLIGNSSSGMIESPFFRVPVLNIGSRQLNRERGDNVIDVAYCKEDIVKGIHALLQTKQHLYRYNPYDLGIIPEKEMVNQLKLLLRKPELLNKKLRTSL